MATGEADIPADLVGDVSDEEPQPEEPQTQTETQTETQTQTQIETGTETQTPDTETQAETQTVGPVETNEVSEPVATEVDAAGDGEEVKETEGEGGGEVDEDELFGEISDDEEPAAEAEAAEAQGDGAQVGEGEEATNPEDELSHSLFGEVSDEEEGKVEEEGGNLGEELFGQMSDEDTAPAVVPEKIITDDGTSGYQEPLATGRRERIMVQPFVSLGNEAKLSLLRLPRSVELATVPWDTDDFLENRGDLRTDPCDVIRWKWAEANTKKQTNARLVKFEDGSQFLFIGKRPFRVGRSKQNPRKHLLFTTIASEKPEVEDGEEEIAPKDLPYDTGIRARRCLGGIGRVVKFHPEDWPGKKKRPPGLWLKKLERSSRGTQRAAAVIRDEERERKMAEDDQLRRAKARTEARRRHARTNKIAKRKAPITGAFLEGGLDQDDDEAYDSDEDVDAPSPARTGYGSGDESKLLQAKQRNDEDEDDDEMLEEEDEDDFQPTMRKHKKADEEEEDDDGFPAVKKRKTLLEDSD